MATTEDGTQPADADPSPAAAKRKPEADHPPLDPPSKAARPDADEESTAAAAAARAADKGKGKMVVEEEEEEETDEEEEEVGGGDGDAGDESDGFCEDPLAEVDLNNILPSRTRRRAPTTPGAYLVSQEAEDDDDDDEDADVASDEVDGDEEDGEESD